MLFNVFKFAAAVAAVTTINFTNIKGKWFDVTLVGGPALGFIGNGTANASVRWGTSTGAGRPGYDFETLAIPQLTVRPQAAAMSPRSPPSVTSTSRSRPARRSSAPS